MSFVQSSARHWRRLALCTSAGAFTGFANLAEGACDALRVDTDGTIVYAQPVERPSIVSHVPAAWALTTGWTITAAGVATHTAGTTALTYTTAAPDPLIVNEYYAVVFTVAGRTAGSVTAKLGTTAGTARSTNATFVEIIQAQAATVNFVPSTDFDGTIDITAVWAIPATSTINSGVWEPFSALKVVCTAAVSAPGTITSAKVDAGWYRYAKDRSR